MKDATAYSPALRQCWRDIGLPAALITRRGLPEYTEPDELIVAKTDDDGREHLLIPDAARAWNRMQAAADGENVSILIVSAYRSVARQIEIIKRKLHAGQSPEEILSVSAPPGCSEHHTGRAIDVGTQDSRPLEAEFEDTPAFHWLAANAGAYGFTLSYPRGNRWGYSYEPWHWCFTASADTKRERK